MKNLFQSVMVSAPKLNKFDLSHERKMSMKAGYLYPCYLQECVPGDRVRISPSVMARLMPMLAPMMHRVNIHIEYFKVPYRLLWNEFEDAMTGGREGTASPVWPFITIKDANRGYMKEGSLWDFMGLPSIDDSQPVSQEVKVSALPFRAYQLIWNTYYRNETLSAEVPFSKASGDMNSEVSLLLGQRLRCFEKEYFTSALPWAQRGNPVEIPVDGDVDPSGMRTGTIRKVSDGSLASTGSLGSSLGVEVRGVEEVYHDVDGVGTIENGSMLVSAWRRAMAIQKWLEKAAVGGYRYIEQVLVQFGVRSSDARLQRPELIGGTNVPIAVSEVLSSYQDPAGDGAPQGNMAGHGIAVGNGQTFSTHCEEHMFIMGIISITPKTNYFQGIPRLFRREDKFDFLWPDFANIGEQEVKVGELWYDQGQDYLEVDETFGYQSRYAEYKYMPSSIHGKFRSELLYWHMARKFDEKPVLNVEFVDADPIDRVFAVEDPTQDKYLVQMYTRVDALRPLPYYSTPGV